MPKSQTKSRKATRVKVVNARSSRSGAISFLKTKVGMLTVVAAFVLIGAGTLSWASAATTTYSLWTKSTVPKTITDSDAQSVELGLKFKAKYAGEVSGLRFYKGPQNTGTHTGSLWTGDGRRLATVTFANETASGWQTAKFAQPVAIAANTTYVISYFAPKGHYSVNENYFATERVKGPLTALKNGAERGNGVYSYANASTFPNSTYKASNYWVDVLFTAKTFNPTTKPAAPTNLQAVVSGTGVTLKWQASATTGVTYYEILRDSQVIGRNETGAGYNDAGLVAGKTYTYQVRAIDAAGQASSLSNSAQATIQATPVPPPVPTPSPTPPPTSTTNCPLPRYPVASCTGVPAGTTLTPYAGSLVITAPGTVIDGKLVNGGLDIRANNVVIKNSQINGPVINDNTATRYSFTIQDSWVRGAASGCGSFGNGAIGVANYTATRVRVTGFPDAFRVAGSNITIQDSYATLCSANPDDHSDGIQAYGAAGGKNIFIRHNTLDQRGVTNGAATAPLFLPSEDRQGNAGATISVTDNLLAGGGFTLRAYGLDFPAVTGNKIVDNTWGYGPLDVTCNTIGSWSGNAVVNFDWNTGQIVSQVRALNDCN
jgi:hypothetical protein